MGESIFSVMGPVMVGPSSSHTAGVARLGKIARNVLIGEPERAEIEFFGSLAATYRGHGSDLAIIGGLLGFDSDDPRIADAFQLAGARNFSFSFSTQSRVKGHPNTLEITLQNSSDRVQLLGSSRGGGNVRVERLNGFEVNFAGKYPVLWILHRDRPGMVGWVASLLAEGKINIAQMVLGRTSPRGLASMVLECDIPIPEKIREKIESRQFVENCRYIPPVR